jgi:hypothetical protein
VNVNECFECGAAAQHHHHVVPRSLGGTKTVPLCALCHGKAHGRTEPFRNTRELTKAALAAKAAKGERTGTVRYGFTADANGKLVVCPAEQAVIAQVRALRDAGLSQRGIVAALATGSIVGRTGRALDVRQVHNISKMEPVVGRTGRPLALLQVQNILAIDGVAL